MLKGMKGGRRGKKGVEGLRILVDVGDMEHPPRYLILLRRPPGLSMALSKIKRFWTQNRTQVRHEHWIGLLLGQVSLREEPNATMSPPHMVPTSVSRGHGFPWQLCAMCFTGAPHTKKQALWELKKQQGFAWRTTVQVAAKPGPEARGDI